MRVVMGTQSLDAPGGTESYVTTVARELQRLGHDVLLRAQELGAVADAAESEGLQIAREPWRLPPQCDALFAHDAASAASLADHYPGTRLVCFVHSDLYDHQLPPLLPGVVSAIIVTADRIAARVRALALDAPIVRLRQPIDTERYADAGPLRERPRRALLLSSYLRGARRDALVEAWEAAGIECVQVGAPGQMRIDVRAAIADADIVVAKSRAALEAMSCGRAVYLFDEFGGDGWVTPESYPAMEADGFAGLATGGPRTARGLRDDLAAYDSQMGWVNRELVKTHHGARGHACAVVDVLRGDSPASEERPPLAELARLVRIAWESERRAIGLQREVVALRERLLALEEAH